MSGDVVHDMSFLSGDRIAQSGAERKRDGHWFMVDAEAADAFSQRPERLWEQVLRRAGGVAAWSLTFPDDPAMN